MKKFFLLSPVILIFSVLINSSVIQDLEKPYGLYVNKKKIFIFDGSTYSYKIYSLNDLKKIGEFGRKGEGPGEFRGSHEVSFSANKIFLCGSFTLFRFSENGELLDQSKKPSFLYLKPVGNNFVGKQIEYNRKELKSYNIVSLYNKKFQVIKKIYMQFKRKMKSESKNIKQDIMMVEPLFKVQTNADKIFIADCRKGFHVEVFNSFGDYVYSISMNLPKVRITQEFRDRVMKMYKSSKLWIENKRNFNYIFPNYFSDIKTFRVADNKIYIVTYLKKGEKNQLFILDLKGGMIKETFIPFKSRIYDFNNDYFYYLEDIEEEWTLFSINLNAIEKPSSK